jgi:small subunit ribosomal protein S6
LRTYEFIYIVSPEVEEENLEALTAKVDQMITDGGGEVLRRQPWGRRRLAYPIRNFREGHYILDYLELEPTAISELKARLALTEEVIRYLLVRTDEVPPAPTPSEPAAAEPAEEMPEEETPEEPVEEIPEEETPEEPGGEPDEELTEPEAASDQESEDTDQEEEGE